MSGHWKEVVKLSFKGERFRDHALDLTALSELSQFQKIIAETAKELWRTAHPERERLPRRFEDRIRLCLRRIEDGSAVAPLEVFIEEEPQMELYEEPPGEIEEAISLAHDVLRALEREEPLPEKFPRSLVTEYAKWGQALADDEAIEISRAGAEPARMTAALRSRWESFSELTHESQTDVTGEVLEANVRQGRFEVWLDSKTGVTVAFSPEQEEIITNALREHRTRRLRVAGKGEFTAQGKLQRIVEVGTLELLALEEVPFDENERPIEEVLAELAAEVPAEEWDRLPADLSDQLDHYLYGHPKR